MAITECGRGHVYDTNQYAVCPYCNSGSNMINFGTGDSGRTVAPGGFRNAAPSPPDAGQTVAPAGYGTAPQPARQPVPQRAFVEEIGKTVAPESFRKAQEQENKTVAVFQKKMHLDPVVGWLVCIEGPEKGRDFRLWSKINTIGRGDNMDVVLKDTTISKENHARLAYDPKHNDFRIIPGNSVNNIYLNDEPIYVPCVIKAYDILEMGDSKLIFVPFCCDRFQWDAAPQREA